MTNQTPDVKVARNYDAGIIALVAILLVVVIGGGIYLVSIAVGAAPIVSTIFGMMFAILTTVYIVSLMVQNRWAIQKISDTSMSTADAFAKALMSYKSQKNEATVTPVIYAPPAQNQIADVRRHFNGGLPPGVSGARVSDGAKEYTASTASLIAALTILSRGEDPTRAHFREHGIMSSIETAGAVDFLASLGYVDPVVQGAPAQWASTVMPSDVGAIADHLRTYVPALPVFQPVFAETAVSGRSARQQAGRGRGRR